MECDEIFDSISEYESDDGSHRPPVKRQPARRQPQTPADACRRNSSTHRTGNRSKHKTRSRVEYVQSPDPSGGESSDDDPRPPREELVKPLASKPVDSRRPSNASVHVNKPAPSKLATRVKTPVYVNDGADDDDDDDDCPQAAMETEAAQTFKQWNNDGVDLKRTHKYNKEQSGEPETETAPIRKLTFIKQKSQSVSGLSSFFASSKK